MPINFGILNSQDPKIQSITVPGTGGGDGGGIGDLFEGLKGLVGGINNAVGGSNTDSPAAYNNTSTYGSNQEQSGLGTSPQAPSAFTPVAGPNFQQAVSLKNLAQQGVNLGLNPKFAQVIPQVMSDLKQMGFEPIIASGLRTPEEQAQKVAQGYSKTMHSNHLTGNAIDIIDKRYGWDTGKYGTQIGQFAQAMNQVASKYGLGSGTKWKSFGPYGDFAHLQFTSPQQATTVGATLSTNKNIPISKPVTQDPQLQQVMRGIAYVESSGAKDPYTLMSKPSRNGDRAYGKYQIMGSNIPSWTKEAVGKAYTPQEFMANPDIQEQTAAYHLGKNLKQYGNPDDVASVWFSGRPMKKAGNAKDVYGTTVPQYVKKFRQGAGFKTSMNDPKDFNDFNSINPPSIPNQLYEDTIKSLDQGHDSYASNGPKFNAGTSSWVFPGQPPGAPGGMPVVNPQIQSNMPNAQDPEQYDPNYANPPSSQLASTDGINWGILNSNKGKIFV